MTKTKDQLIETIEKHEIRIESLMSSIEKEQRRNRELNYTINRIIEENAESTVRYIATINKLEAMLRDSVKEKRDSHGWFRRIFN